MKTTLLITTAIILASTIATDARVSAWRATHSQCPGGFKNQYFWDPDSRIIAQERRDNNGALCEPREHGSSGGNPFAALVGALVPGHKDHDGHHGHHGGHESHHDGHGGHEGGHGGHEGGHGRHEGGHGGHSAHR